MMGFKNHDSITQITRITVQTGEYAVPSVITGGCGTIVTLIMLKD